MFTRALIPAAPRRRSFPIVATAAYKAYPSIAFDGTDLLWIAYEEGGRGWGKDFGAYRSTGVALYQGRLIKLRGLEPNGSFVDLDASLDSVLVGAPNEHADRLGSQLESAPLDPNPNLSEHRLPDAHLMDNYSRSAHNTMPRLTIDGSGRIWLAFRTSHPTRVGHLGTVWYEYLLSFNGKSWTQPIFMDHTDNLLDNRPALASLGNGHLLIVNSSDGRRDLAPDRSGGLESFFRPLQQRPLEQ